MKYLFVLLFAAFGLSVSAQNTNPEVNRLMEQELKMIQKDLVNQKLTDEQTAELKKLLTVKAEKVHAIREGNLGKMEMSKSMASIRNEFEPAILEVLNEDQKKAFKVSPRNKKRFKAKN